MSAPEVLTAFMVVVTRGGDIAVYGKDLPEVLIQREATLTDIQMYCTQAAQEATLLRMREALAAPSDPSVPSDAVKKAIRKRGQESD